VLLSVSEVNPHSSGVAPMDDDDVKAGHLASELHPSTKKSSVSRIHDIMLLISWTWHIRG